MVHRLIPIPFYTHCKNIYSLARPRKFTHIFIYSVFSSHIVISNIKFESPAWFHMSSFAPAPHRSRPPPWDVAAVRTTATATARTVHPSRVVAAVRDSAAAGATTKPRAPVLRTSFGRVFPWAAAGDALKRGESITRSSGGLTSAWPTTHFKRPATAGAKATHRGAGGVNKTIEAAAAHAAGIHSQRPALPHRVVRPKKFRVIRKVRGSPAPPAGWRPEFKDELAAGRGRSRAQGHRSRRVDAPAMVTLEPSTPRQQPRALLEQRRPRSAGEVEGIRGEGRSRAASARSRHQEQLRPRRGGASGASWGRGGNVVLTGRALRSGGVTVDFDAKYDEVRMSFNGGGGRGRAARRFDSNRPYDPAAARRFESEQRGGEGGAARDGRGRRDESRREKERAAAVATTQNARKDRAAERKAELGRARENAIAHRVGGAVVRSTGRKQWNAHDKPKAKLGRAATMGGRVGGAANSARSSRFGAAGGRTARPRRRRNDGYRDDGDRNAFGGGGDYDDDFENGYGDDVEGPNERRGNRRVKPRSRDRDREFDEEEEQDRDRNRDSRRSRTTNRRQRNRRGGGGGDSEDDLEWPTSSSHSKVKATRRGGGRSGRSGGYGSDDVDADVGRRTQASRRRRGRGRDRDDGGDYDVRDDDRGGSRRRDHGERRFGGETPPSRGTWYEDEVVNRSGGRGRGGSRSGSGRGGSRRERRRWDDEEPQVFDEMVRGYESSSSVAATRLVQRWAATESGLM